MTVGDHDVQAVHHARASHSNGKDLHLNFFLDVEICLDNVDRFLVIKGDFCKLREL